MISRDENQFILTNELKQIIQVMLYIGLCIFPP